MISDVKQTRTIERNTTSRGPDSDEDLSRAVKSNLPIQKDLEGN